MEQYYFYVPDKVSYTTPADRGLVYEEVNFPSTDGTLLHAWLLPARGERHGTIIFYHGNNKNISGHLRYVEWLPERGYDVFLFDYRGYGKSEGMPTPGGVHEDSVAALEYLRSRSDIARDNIFVFGQSLGGNYALSALAKVSREGIRGAVVEGAFASHREIARDKIASYALPSALKNSLVDMVIGDTYDAEAALRQIDDIPVLVIHNLTDEVVPFRHAELLESANPHQIAVWAVPAGRHLDTFVLRNQTWRDALIAHLQRETPAPSGRSQPDQNRVFAAPSAALP